MPETKKKNQIEYPMALPIGTELKRHKRDGYFCVLEKAKEYGSETAIWLDELSKKREDIRKK